jgi:hypothetical protein
MEMIKFPGQNRAKVSKTSSQSIKPGIVVHTYHLSCTEGIGERTAV